MHWTLLVVDFVSHLIQYHDSMAPNDPSAAADGIRFCKLMHRFVADLYMDKLGQTMPNPDKWTIDVKSASDIPLQHNGCDCGVFTCLYANSISLGEPFLFNHTNIPSCRRQIALVLYNLHLHQDRRDNV